jgi:DNA-binding transcriptional MerR regulator
LRPVKTKGSEVGFSLMKIEKILALKQQTQSNETVKTIRQEELPQGQNINTWKQFPEPQKHLFKKQETVPQTELKKQLSGLIDDLTKPENVPEQSIPGLLKKRRVKKRRRPNL